MPTEAKKDICEALCLLAQDRPISTVSITALTKKAGVNRSTFYYHFESVDAVLEYMVQQFLDEYFVFFCRAATPSALTWTFEDLLNNEKLLCECVFQHRKEVLFFLNDHNYGVFKRLYMKKLTAVYESFTFIQIDHRTGQKKELKRGNMYDYWVNNLCYQSLGVLEYWARRRFNESPESLAEIGWNLFHNVSIDHYPAETESPRVIYIDKS